MKLFEQINGKVQTVDAHGRGIVDAGKEVAVNFAVPGDLVRVELMKRVRGALRGRILEVTSPSPDRVTPRCPYVGKCGGCLWQMMDYPAQLRWKQELVNREFARAGLDVRIALVEPSPEIYYHRNRMDYVIAATDGTSALGLKSPGEWWNVLDLSTCFLLSEDAVRVMNEVREWMRERAVAPWNLKTHSGFARYCVIREGKFTGERMVTIVTGPGTMSLEQTADLVRRLSPLTTSLFWGINPKITDLSFSEELHLLHGKDRLTEKINDAVYSIRPNSFFQTNAHAAGRLQNMVVACADAKPSDTVLDLYCGVGFFSLPLAKRAQRVIGIELDAEAIALARENAQANAIGNAEFHATDAASFLLHAPHPDIIVVDPPRAGLHPRVLESIISAAPRTIVYVSCNYRALSRELPSFLARYRIKSIQALDMFPHTPHVEIAVALDKMA